MSREFISLVQSVCCYAMHVYTDVGKIIIQFVAKIKLQMSEPSVYLSNLYLNVLFFTNSLYLQCVQERRSDVCE